ncbi:hypothetical protein [Ferrimonas balearica]|uniref:hypothetical protein n=1 Tax=Ferrimonas balearica TaxID=44012 RepID=UPI001C9925D6|nr:hypothetical protein [Ferrimonas balearica]MBY5922643.1 hypothetical protein [Ferrimonas balearica]MBY5995627.1 hypothetical protein [Ferrimonas balearica]
MTLIRTLGSKWAVAELAEALTVELAKEMEIHRLFSGAATLDQVAEKIITLTLAEAPELLKEGVDEWTLLPVVSIAFQLMVVKSLQGERLTQIEHLIIPVSRHLAAQPDPKDLPEPYRAMKARILDLYQRWDTAKTEQRNASRNMMRHQ